MTLDEAAEIIEVLWGTNDYINPHTLMSLYDLFDGHVPNFSGSIPDDRLGIIIRDYAER